MNIIYQMKLKWAYFQACRTINKCKTHAELDNIEMIFEMYDLI